MKTMKQLISPTFVHENAGWCQRFVDRSFGIARLEGGVTTPVHKDMIVYPSAYAGWLATKYKHTNRNFPKNMSFPVWFEWWGDLHNGQGYKRYDHVAIYHKGKVYSSPLTGYGYAWFNSVDDLVGAFGGNMRYIGWSRDVSGVTIIEEEEMITTNGLNILYRLRFGGTPSEADRKRFVGKWTFDAVDKEFKSSNRYKLIVEKAKKGELDITRFAPSDVQRHTPAMVPNKVKVPAEFEEIKDKLYRRK